jgi:deoxyribonuclease-4
VTTLTIGSHVSPSEPIGAARAEGAEAAQIFMSNPQSWKAPLPRDDAEALKASGFPIYVHSPYLVNVVSPNNRIRIPSRKILQNTCTAAATVGARAVIVHGGHTTADDDVANGFDRWRKALERLETDVPVYLENTAGGDNAMTRQFDVIARLWDVIGDMGVGFCLDTCHAHASGESLVGLVERVMGITGRIDLVHCNDSKDPAGSGRDRHEHLGQGLIDPEHLVAVVREANAPVIIETESEGRKDDLTWLRERLA